MDDVPEARASEDATAVLLAGLALDRRTRIVDVGANPLTPPPYADLLARAACEVVGFEPQAEAFDRLEASKSALETYFPFAVGDGSPANLKIFHESGFTSVYEPHLAAMNFIGFARHARVRERVSFTTVALDAAPEVGVFDLMKIDIQGGEVAVFQGAVQAMRQTLAVIVELRYFPLYVGEPMLGGVDTELRAQGFFLHKFMFNQQARSPHSQQGRLRRRFQRDQLLDGDAVYLRDLSRLEERSNQELMHLCVLASGVFQSHNLVLQCLDMLVARGTVAADLPERYVDALPEKMKA